MKKLLTAALLGAALLTGTAGAVVEPTEAFYVADYADVLSEETEQYIIDQNEALFEATGGQIVVVAVDFMDGMDSADYAMAVAENWGGIGDAERNNGFLLVYAVGENKVWAMAGAGIEDALSASTIEGWLEDDFYDGYDAGEYDSATRAFFDDVYGWYESYYATSSTGGAAQPGYEYLPQPENDHFYAYTGSSLIGTLLSLFLAPLIVVIIVVAILADGWRYRRYHRRYMGPGMPPPPYVYRPFIFGRPHRPRPPRPPRGPRPPHGRRLPQRRGLPGRRSGPLRRRLLPRRRLRRQIPRGRRLLPRRRLPGRRSRTPVSILSSNKALECPSRAFVITPTHLGVRLWVETEEGRPWTAMC